MKELTLKEMFYNSDRRVEKDFVDPSKKDLYLFWKLAELVPTSWTDKDGNEIPMNFINEMIGPVDLGYWRILEREYFHNYSSTKITSVILDEIAEEERWFDPEDSAYKTEVANLAKDIWRLYGENWCRMWYALKEKYRPLDNVDGIEETSVEGDITTTRTPDLDTKTTGDDIVDSADAIKRDTVGDNSNNGVYGFNSSSSVPAATANTTTTYGNTLNQWSSQDSDVKAQGTANTQEVARTKTAHDTNVNLSGTDETITDDDRITTLKRHGNIGVTKSTDLLESEMEFRKNYNFYKIMFDNIDDILTCHCYKGGC